MVFFTLGNLLTLGIVVLVLILFRLSDRKHRSLDQLRDKTRELKKEIEKFADQRAEEVRSLGIDLKVEKESGKELMNRLHLTNDELAEKAEAIAQIEERLKNYGSSLEELRSMTERVQENLGRLQDESAFVDGVGRKVSEAKSGLEALERGIGGIEARFEKENAEALEKTAAEISASFTATVSDLAAEAETIERRVEDHREALNKIEKEREASLARDMELIDKTLEKAVEQAGHRADRMEEAALQKLKDHAQERILKLKTDEEEKLKAYQETAKLRVAEVQSLVKSIKEEWRTDRQEWEAKEKIAKEEYKKGLEEIKSGTAAAGVGAAASLENLENRLEELKEKTDRAVGEHGALLHKAAADQDAALRKAVSDQETLLRTTTDDLIGKTLEKMEAKLETYLKAQETEFIRLEELKDSHARDLNKALDDWRIERQELETRESAFKTELKEKENLFLQDWEKNLDEVKSAMRTAETQTAASLETLENSLENRLEELRVKTGRTIADQEALLNKTVSDQEALLHTATEKIIEDAGKITSGQESLLQKTITDHEALLHNALVRQESLLHSATDEMMKKTLEEAEAKLETYRKAQEADFKRLEGLKDSHASDLTQVLENWRTERQNLEAKESAFRAELEEKENVLLQEWEKKLEKLKTAALASETRTVASLDEMKAAASAVEIQAAAALEILENNLENRLEELRIKTEKTVTGQDTLLHKTISSQEALLHKTISDHETLLNKTIADQEALLNSTAEKIAGKTEKTASDHETLLRKAMSDQDALLHRTLAGQEKLFRTTTAEQDESLQKAISDHETLFRRALDEQEELLHSTTEGMRKTAFEETETKLNAYLEAQDAEFKRLETLKDKLEQDLTRTLENWRIEKQDIAAKDKAFWAELEEKENVLQDDWEQISRGMNTAAAAAESKAAASLEEMKITVEAAETRALTSLKTLENNVESRLEELSVKTNETVADQEDSVNKAIADQDAALHKAITEQEALFRRTLTEQEALLRKTTEDMIGKNEKAVSDHETLFRNALAEQGELLRSTTDEMRKTALEETEAKLNAYLEAQDAEFKRLEALRDGLAQNLAQTMKNWRAERKELEAKDSEMREERKKDIEEIKTSTAAAENETAASLEKLENRMEELRKKTGETITFQESVLLKAVEGMKHDALEASESKLNEYRQVQDGEFKRLESLIEDSRRLDEELRRNMQNITAKVRKEFDLFEEESEASRKAAAAEFSRTTDELKSGMEDMEKDLAGLKNTAREELSDKLAGFEEDFHLELSRRNNDMDRRFAEWQETLGKRLSDYGNEAAVGRKELEIRLGEELKRNIAIQHDRILLELESLKTETGALEESIRGRMDSADESLAAYKELLDHNLEEARQNAEHTIKTEIGELGLSTAERIKQNQRELDERIREISDYVEGKNAGLADLLDVSRRNIADLEGRIASIRTAIDDAYQDADIRRNEIVARSDEQAKSLDAGVKEAERRIKEFFDQAKLIDRADELKIDMERRIEDLRGDIDRLDQRRIETSQMENEFSKIRRLTDEVNAKMARIASEKYRIDKMEADFNRLLHISKGVEEKLTQVTASDDVLQETLVQIRKFEEALAAADEKFQRLEKKESILEATSDSIDRNFKALNEIEKAIKRAGEDIARMVSDENDLREAIGILADQNEKANETAERISALDDALSKVAEKTGEMQKAREWIARAETRLEEINKQAQTQFNIMEAIMSGKKDAPPVGKGAPSIQKKENVIQLARQGWKDEEIAKSLKISLSEVELIRETFGKNKS